MRLQPPLLAMSFLSLFRSGAEDGRSPRQELHGRTGIELQMANGDDNSLMVVHRLRELESQALLEVEERKSFEKARISCEMDTYSLLLLRLVQWWDGDDSIIFWTKHGEFRGKFRRTPWVAFIHALLLFMMASGCQLAVTILLFANSKATMHKWSHYLDSHDISLHVAGEALNAAVSTPAGATLGGTVSVGEASIAQALTHMGFMANADKISGHVLNDCLSTRKVQYQMCYAIVMLLWIAKMMPEFRQARYVWRAIWCMEVRKDNTMPLLEADGVTILRLDRWLQVLLLIMIPCVRFVVAVLVAYAGIDFLLAQSTTGNIVLKALCMQFVTDIDNLFLLAFTSSGGRASVSTMKLFVKPEKTPFWTIEPDLWDNGVGGLTYIAFGLMVAALFTGCVGRFAEFGDWGIVKYNLMYFRYKCQDFCNTFPDSCPQEDIMAM